MVSAKSIYTYEHEFPFSCIPWSVIKAFTRTCMVSAKSIYTYVHGFSFSFIPFRHVLRCLLIDYPLFRLFVTCFQSSPLLPQESVYNMQVSLPLLLCLVVPLFCQTVCFRIHANWSILIHIENEKLNNIYNPHFPDNICF